LRDEEREEKIRSGKKRIKRSTAVKICCCGLRPTTATATGPMTSIKYDKQMTRIKEKRGMVMGTMITTEDNRKKAMRMIQRQVEGAKTTKDWGRRTMSQNWYKALPPSLFIGLRGEST